MPAHKATNKSKKAIEKAVGQNMHELNMPGVKSRSQKQKIAIAFSEARGSSKKNKK